MTITQKTKAKNNEQHSAVIAAFDAATLNREFFNQIRSIFVALEFIDDVVPGDDPEYNRRQDAMTGLIATGKALSELYLVECDAGASHLLYQINELSAKV